MTKEEMKQLYNAISTVFEGDYTPEEDLLEYNDTFNSDDEYFEALAEIFEKNNGAEFKAYVDGAKECIFDFYEKETDVLDCHPAEYKILKDSGFFD